MNALIYQKATFYKITHSNFNKPQDGPKAKDQNTKSAKIQKIRNTESQIYTAEQ